MSRPYREIGKPFATRTLELIHALQLISDSIQHLREGKARYLIVLSGQLRSLLTEKSKALEPLLFYIAKILNPDLSIYTSSNIDNSSLPESLREGMVFHASGLSITPERQFREQEKVSFPEVLDIEAIEFRGNRYSARKIIEWYANKAGTDHYE